MSFTHQALALLVAGIWGSNFALIEIGLAELPPFWFVTLRFTLVALPLVFLLPRPQLPLWILIAYGLLIGVGQFGVLFWAMRDDISPGLASLVVQTQVFFTVILAALGPAREPVKAAQLLALAICFAGLLLIFIKTDGHTTTVGVALVLFAALSWAGGNQLVKQAGDFNIIAFLAWSSLFAIPLLLFISLSLEGIEQISHSTSSASALSWGIVLWQTIGNTLIGYGLWNLLLGKYSAAEVVPWALLVPVSGISTSAIFLNEPLPWWKLLAAALIFTGLAINLYATRRQNA